MCLLQEPIQHLSSSTWALLGGKVKLFSKSTPRKKTVIPEAESMFLDLLFVGRYGDMKRCPVCYEKPSYHRVNNRKCFACSYCGNQIFPTAGLIMHKSVTPISKWLLAYYLVITNPKITAEKMQDYLGVTYKTAWRIREQIKDDFNRYLPYYRQDPRKRA